MRLFGKSQDGSKKEGEYRAPKAISAIAVGRNLDEIHVLHACAWSDVQGKEIADLALHYTDGSVHNFPIGYGVHVRDWQRLVTEEFDYMDDPDTKVIWRGEGIKHFRATSRVFKSLFKNPYPAKEVESVGFISREQIASHVIFAATVVDFDPSRVLTPEVPIPSPKQKFDGTVTVQLEDREGNPIDEVWIYPNYSVPERNWLTVAEPFYTTVEGLGTSRYPKASSTMFLFNAHKEGWLPSGQWIDLKKEGQPDAHFVVVIRMERDPAWVTTVSPSRGEPGAGTNTFEAIAQNDTPSGGDGTALEILGDGAQKKPLSAYRPNLILFINFPEGSRVRVESSSSLSQPQWQEEAVIERLPFSGYPYTCNFEDCGMDSGY